MVLLPATGDGGGVAIVVDSYGEKREAERALWEKNWAGSDFGGAVKWLIGVAVTPEMHFVPKHVSGRRNAFRDLKSPNTSRDVRNAFRDEHQHEMHFVTITPTPK